MVFALDQYQMRQHWRQDVLWPMWGQNARRQEGVPGRRTLLEVKTALHMDVSERKLLICLFPVQTNLYAMGVLDI